jgi:alginate O-acetyltransferase complex protein AlgI
LLFNSYIFLFVFLPLTWIAFRALARFGLARVAIGTLSVASLIFYSYWNPPFVALILCSVVFNFLWGRVIARAEHKPRWRLAVGVAVNLASIAYFKYTGFLLDNVNGLTGAEIEIPDIFLPLGISFFTFQQIAYLVDCHRRLTEAHGFFQYCLFVTFFPQLIAGPIVHHSEMMPQFVAEKIRRIDRRKLALGLALLAIGLFKKVIIADTLSPWVGQVFDAQGSPLLIASWIGTLSYTFQIYFDFSGYSDMAMGLGYLFNIELPVNFASPYRATNPIEFWRRWHMTLSRFLREYLYFPLGGNRKGPVRRYANLLATMLLGGLWHGAAWTFVLWGGLHGLYLCIAHAWRKLGERAGFTTPRPVGWLLTFLAVAVAWVFFRAPSLDKAMDIVGGLVGTNGVEDLSAVFVRVEGNQIASFLPFDERFAVLGLLLAICLALPNSWTWAREKMERVPVLAAAAAALLLIVSVLGMTRISEFLYFQF